jgi:hypothetical protein
LRVELLSNHGTRKHALNFGGIDVNEARCWGGAVTLRTSPARFAKAEAIALIGRNSGAFAARGGQIVNLNGSAFRGSTLPVNQKVLDMGRSVGRQRDAALALDGVERVKRTDLVGQSESGDTSAAAVGRERRDQEPVG